MIFIIITINIINNNEKGTPETIKCDRALDFWKNKSKHLIKHGFPFFIICSCVHKKALCLWR